MEKAKEKGEGTEEEGREIQEAMFWMGTLYTSRMGVLDLRKKEYYEWAWDLEQRIEVDKVKAQGSKDKEQEQEKMVKEEMELNRNDNGSSNK